MNRALDFQRLVLVAMLAAPVSLAGLLLQPFVIMTMLTPPTGNMPHHVMFPRTLQDRIDRTHYFLRSRRTPDDLEKALEAAHDAVRYAPESGDPYVARAYARHASGDRQGALSDLDKALARYERAGNAREVQNTLSVYIPQIRDAPGK